MRGICAIAFAVTLPVQALALSCMQPDAVRDYKAAEASEDVWIVVNGTLRFDERALPKTDLMRQDSPPQTDIPARLTGMSLNDTGFDRPFDQDITLRILCFGPWCGGAADGMQAMAYLMRDAAGYVMFADPCGGRVYPDASAKTLRRVTSCFQGRECIESEPGR